MIEFLVREHLTMSHTAQKADLSDPDVIMKFARKVGDQWVAYGLDGQAR